MRGSLPRAATLFEKLPRALRRHRLMTAWMRLTGENPLQLVRIRGRSFGYADLNDGFLRLIVIEGDFEHDFFRIADALLARGGVFVDVGANHGLLSFGLAEAHRATAQFHLFEPNSRLVESILATRALYPAMNMVVNAAAVSDTAGTVSFLMNPDQTGSSHIVKVGGTPVPAVRLDDYLSERGIPGVALLKIDVEGYEMAVLAGANANLEAHRVQAIYFEYFEKYLTRGGGSASLLALLASLDYQVCFCRQHDLRSRGGGSHTIREGLPGHGLPLLPAAGQVMPPMTDLLAVPRENLVTSA